MLPLIVDSQDIKLYCGDILEDNYGCDWILSEENGLFYFLMRGRDGTKMIDRLPIGDAKHLRLKWNKRAY